MSNAWGLIETRGLPAAIEAADAAVKSADVKLLGIELTNGGGLVVVKLLGDVGAIKAAVACGAKAGEKVGQIWATHVIARPNTGIKPAFYPEFFPREEQAACDTASHAGIIIPEPNTEDKDRAAINGNNESEVRQEGVTEESRQLAETTESEPSCNLCNDPQCPRKKGEPKVNCINFNLQEGKI